MYKHELRILQNIVFDQTKHEAFFRCDYDDVCEVSEKMHEGVNKYEFTLDGMN